MGATFSRLKNWIAEVLTYADLNAEIDNILNNLGPAGVDDYSTNVAQMQSTTDPGEVGTESLATSLAGEIQRLRFAIKEIKGTGAAQWYSSVGTSLTELLSAIGGGIAANRIISGAHSSNSSAPRFLIPNGSAATAILDGSPTSFVYSIDSTQYTISTDLTISGLATAPSSNNTCLVNDAGLTVQESSKWTGEDGSTLTVDAMGSEISALINKFAAFKVVHGGSTEYFIGYVKSSTELTNCLRGYFLDSALAAVPRIAIADNDTITLMKLSWVFANTAGGTAVSYVNPIVANTQPTDTTVYWYDLTNNTWKTYNGSSWVAANATLIGLLAQDSTNCKVARGFNFFGSYDHYSNMQIDYVSATTVQQRNFGGKVGVGASQVNFQGTKPVWDITTALESGAEAASTTYFIYVGESGQLKLSVQKPHLSSDLGRNWYHPSENWRALAYIFNDASSDFVANSISNYLGDPNTFQQSGRADEMQNIGITQSLAGNALTVTITGHNGSDLSASNPAVIGFRSATVTSGVVIKRRLYNNLTMTVASGATLGHSSGFNQYVWIYLIDDNGVLDIGVSGVSVFQDGTANASTLNSGSATSGSVLYSSITHSGAKGTRIAGRLLSNQATAGTWTTAIGEVTVKPTPVANIEDWNTTRTFTPDPTPFGTVGNVFFVSRRVGDTMHVRGYWTNGTVTANAAAIAIPLQWNPSAIPSAGKKFMIGHFTSSDAGGGTAFTSSKGGPIIIDQATQTAVYFSLTGASSIYVLSNGNACSGNSEGVNVEFWYPVRGWSTYGPAAG